MTQIVNRSESRFSPNAGQTLPVSVLERNSGEPIPAEVIDVSSSGAKLVLSLPLKTDDIVTVHLSFADAAVEMRLTGRICWVRLARDYQWLAGVRFDEAIGLARLKKMAAAGYIEQRDSPRTDVQIPGTARRETLSNEIQVAITDLSATGFRLSSPDVMQAGERVLVGTASRKGNVTFPAHVRWSDKKQDQYSVGCEFVDKDAFRHLKHHLPRRQSDELTDSWSEPLLPRQWSYVPGVALTLALAAWQCRVELPHLVDRAERAWQSRSTEVQSLN